MNHEKHDSPEKYKNKYRIPSTRLQNWDYGWNGAYFITICTKNMESYFGEIVNKKMELSNIGILANDLLHEIKNHSQNVELGEFIVMPNHIHLILILNSGGMGNGGDDVVVVVETRHALSLQSKQKNQQPRQPIGKPISKSEKIDVREENEPRKIQK